MEFNLPSLLTILQVVCQFPLHLKQSGLSHFSLKVYAVAIIAHQTDRGTSKHSNVS